MEYALASFFFKVLLLCFLISTFAENNYLDMLPFCILPTKTTSKLGDVLGIAPLYVANIEGVLCNQYQDYKDLLNSNTEDAYKERLKRIQDFQARNKEEYEKARFAIPHYNRIHLDAKYKAQHGPIRVTKNGDLDADTFGSHEIFESWLEKQAPNVKENIKNEDDAYKFLLWKFQFSRVLQMKATVAETNAIIKLNEYKKKYGITENIEDKKENIKDTLPSYAPEVNQYNTESPISKINKLLTPQQLTDRLNLIARDFSSSLDALVEDLKEEIKGELENTTDKRKQYKLVARLKALSDSNTAKRKAIQLKGAVSFYESLKNAYLETAESSEGYEKEQYQILYDHFDTLFNLAAPIIENYENVRFTVSNKNTHKGTTVGNQSMVETAKSQQSENLENTANGDNDTGDRGATGNDGWNFKIKFQDPHKTLSKEVKRILYNIYEVDGAGTPVTDDLGNIKYIPFNQAFATLLDTLARDITDANDFIVKNEDGSYSYPLLEKMTERYPWVKQLVGYEDEFGERMPGELDYNSQLGSLFFTDFYKAFNSYCTNRDGKVINLNTNLGEDSAMQTAILNYESGHILSDSNLELNVYNTDKTLNQEARKIGMSTIESYKQDILEDSFYVEEEADAVADIFRGLGFNITAEDITSLVHTEGIETLDRALSTAEEIYDGIKNLNNNENLIHAFSSSYKTLARTLGKITTMSNIMSFRQMDKTYQSYSAPSYIDQVVSKIKSDTHYRDYLQEQYGQFKWFFNNGKWRGSWFDLLANSEEVRKNFGVRQMNYLHIGNADIAYNQWSPSQIVNTFMQQYFEVYPNNRTQKFQYADYHFPIFSDTEMAMFIKMPKYTGKFKEKLLPMYISLVRQELYRMEQVRLRKEKGCSPIQNYDKRGSKFCFIPELNSYYKEILEAKDEADRNKVIENAITEILQQKADELYNKYHEDIEKNIQNWCHVKSKEAVQDKILEYIWNSTYAESQINQMFITDIAYYKNSTDLQKRYKEIYASGNRLNTNSKYGKPTQRVLYLADQIITSNAFTGIETSLQKAVDEGRLSKEEKYDILNKFQNINAVDAQAFRTLPSFRSIMDMLGTWEEEKMNPIVERFEKGIWNKADFDVVWNTIKPFYYSQTAVNDGLGGQMKLGTQIKNSEYLMLAAYSLIDRTTGHKTSPHLVGLNKFMLDHKIDMCVFESGVKAGAQGIIDINFSKEKIQKILAANNNELAKKSQALFKSKADYENASDYEKLKKIIDKQLLEKEITQADYNKIMKSIQPSEKEVYEMLKDACSTIHNEGDIIETKDGINYNTSVVHELPMEGYMIAQPTPPHIFDTTSIFGSQFRNLITADLPANISIIVQGRKIEGRNAIIKAYHQLIIQDLLDGFEELKDTFKDIESLQKRLESVIKGNPKYGTDMLNAIQLVDTPNGKQFNLPINNPSTAAKLQEIVYSMFKNSVTIQKNKGAACILVSSYGYTNDLHVIKGEDGSIKEFEVLMPWHSKQFLEPFLVNRKDENGNWYQTIDIKSIKKNDPKLLEGIGYRIPTESKYSIMNFRIKGFLPQSNGSVMMLPADTTVYAGEDFDVDKKFLMFYEYHKTKEGKYITDTYDFTKKPGENTREARHNLLLDMARSIWSHKDISDQINHPGSFDNVKIAARIMDIFDDSSLLQQWASEHKVDLYNTKALWDSLQNTSLDEIDSFLKKTKKEMSPMGIDTYIYNHQQNMAGAGLIGIYANNNTGQAKMQNSHVTLKVPYIIDGKEVSDITQQYTITSQGIKKLISQNAAEFLAASVDNVKDPNLAKLLQKPNTAFLACYLLRLGFSIPQIGLIYKHPTVADIINSTNKISAKAVEAMVITPEEANIFNISDLQSYEVEPNKFDTLDYVQLQRDKFKYQEGIKALNAAIQSIREEGITRDVVMAARERIGMSVDDYYDLEAYAGLKFRTAQTITKMLQEAEIIKTLTQLSRADSPNGAVGIDMSSAIVQKQALDIFNYNAKSNSNPFNNLDTLVSNSPGLNIKSREELEDTFMQQPLSMLQAFYNLGINSTFELLKPYFPTLNNIGMPEIKHIMGHANGHIVSTGVLDTYMKSATIYNMSKTSLFGDDTQHTAREKRTYYMYKFPAEFEKFKLQNEEFSQLGVIKNLKVVAGNIILERAGRLTPDVRERFMRDFDSLLQSSDAEVRDMAAKLFMYSFYKDGLYFGPNSFGTFFSTDFMLNIPGYREALEKANKQEYNQNLLDQFYYYNQSSYIYPEVSASNATMLKNGSISIPTKNVFNRYGKMIGIGSILPYIKIGTQYFKLSTNTFNTAVYTEMPAIKNDLLGTPHYDPNMTLEELIEGLPKEEVMQKATKLGVDTESEDNSIAAIIASMSQHQTINIESMVDPDIESSIQEEYNIAEDFQNYFEMDPEISSMSLADLLNGTSNTNIEYNSQEGLNEEGIIKC